MGNNKNPRVPFDCEYCGKLSSDRPSHYIRKKRHFCSMECYAKFRKEIRPKEEHERWQGGVSQTEAHRRWKKKNPERMAFLKARRYARERGAKGSHTFEQWILLCAENEGKCAICRLKKPLTKDHIVPLSKGGSDNIENIQPLCRNCNSKKWAKILTSTRTQNCWRSHELRSQDSDSGEGGKMSPEQLIEKMACSVMDEWGETPQGYAIQKSHAKYMLLVVLSHIEEIAEIGKIKDPRFPESEGDYYKKVVLKEPYRKLMEGEKHEQG